VIKAQKNGNYNERDKAARAAVRVHPDMIASFKQLCRAEGVPYIQAPYEGLFFDLDLTFISQCVHRI
jgi:5'-3' exonuclease